MNIQIFGIKKCQDTKKAERYFKERKIKFQYVDLTIRGLSKGELNSVKTVIGIDNLIDKAGKLYQQKNLKYIIHDVETVLLNEPLLLKTPIVRNGSKATVGYNPDIWQEWIKG
ncbi:arsenate reductase family protein [Dendrosporobacter sp. 1207_IL3150]|uniref:arsenate reductase family protein n=1 Tax=Dendrosporobacter sp. 1207_IL3150 TaxID=3084054 RepID=UPI002FDB76D3